MRRWWILFLLSLPACAQFGEFAATADGRQLYFSTTLRLTASAASPSESRIFRITDGVVELYAESQHTQSSNNGARSPQVSSDGSVVGFSLDSHAVLQGAKSADLGFAPLVMSRNAQWAALTTPTGPPPTNAPPQSTLINLATGEKFALPEAVAGSTRGASSVASDGTVVFDIGVLGPGLWKQGTFTSLPLRGPFGISAISDNAKVLVYGQLFNFPTNPQQRLIVRDLSTNVETVIFAAPDATGGAAAFGLSNNGQRLLYAVTSGPAGGPAFLADTTNGQSTPLPLPDGELAVAGTLSGNGNIAFVLTSTGRIISIDIANGYALRTLVPPTPYVPGFPTLIPGSLVRINGTLPRTVAALQGHLFMNDIALPVLYANDHEVGAQVPWELAGAAQSSFRVELPGDSPFRQNDFISTFPLLPRFEPLGAGETSIFGFKILRGDFSGLLTTNPKPGDIITAYATGLGPVIGSIPTGQPAPFDQLFPIQGQFTCTFNPYGAPAETLFAGLAPGFLGIYQINFRLPSGPDPGPITGGFCTFSGAGVNGGFSWARP